MILKRFQKESLRDFFVNIASAWFIGGIVTIFFTKPILSLQIIFDIMFSIILTSIFLLVAIQF
jgi:hypothetical protein